MEERRAEETGRSRRELRRDLRRELRRKAVYVMGDSEKLTGIFQNMLIPVPGTINPSGVSLPPTDARDTPFVNYASSLDESGQQALLMELQSVPLATKAILKTLAPGIPEKQQGLLKNIQGEVVELDQSIKKLLLSLWTDDSDGDNPSVNIK